MYFFRFYLKFLEFFLKNILTLPDLDFLLVFFGFQSSPAVCRLNPLDSHPLVLGGCLDNQALRTATSAASFQPAAALYPSLCV